MELLIGKNIQKKRKSMGLTQEQIATALGVSIAAVSKWETGGAYPDITLLSPIARLLDITVDDLLGFEAQLSEQQVMDICDRCAKKFGSASYKDAVGLCEEYLKEYPNNLLLKLQIGSVFMMHMPCSGTEDAASELMDRAIALMQDAAKSNDIEICEAALQGLGAFYLQQERYKDSLNVLDKIHSSVIDPDRMKVSVYYAMGDLKKSKQTAQYLLATHTVACEIALSTLAKIAQKEKDYSLALWMEKMNLQLSQMFDMDKLYGQNQNHYLLIANFYAEQKISQETLDALREFVKCVEMPYCFERVKESPFYDSIKMTTISTSKGYLNRCAYQMVAENPKFNFLKGNLEFLDILKDLEHLPE